MMKFSVCIPTYNRANTLGGTLESLVKQDFKDFEVVVVDDGSVDDTDRVVARYENLLNLKYFKKENGGKHTALNVGLEKAEGELFMILDSDDGLFPDALQRIASVWDSVKDKNNFCGVMCRSSCNGEMIGEPFPQGMHKISYIDFHYGKDAGKFRDCCECIRMDIIGQYRWPQINGTKFVPESYVLDTIGLSYDLVCTNDIVKNVYYSEGGITASGDSHVKKNYLGYLLEAAYKIDTILPQAKNVTLASRVEVWRFYWYLCGIDSDHKGARCRSVSFFGYIVLFLYRMKHCLIKGNK